MNQLSYDLDSILHLLERANTLGIKIEYKEDELFIK